MDETEKKVLKALYSAYLKGDGSMNRITSKKLGIDKDEFQAVIQRFRDCGYLPDSFAVHGGKENSKGWFEQGNDLSDEAIEIAKSIDIQ